MLNPMDTDCDLQFLRGAGIRCVMLPRRDSEKHIYYILLYRQPIARTSTSPPIYFENSSPAAVSSIAFPLNEWHVMRMTTILS